MLLGHAVNSSGRPAGRFRAVLAMPLLFAAFATFLFLAVLAVATGFQGPWAWAGFLTLFLAAVHGPLLKGWAELERIPLRTVRLNSSGVAIVLVAGMALFAQPQFGTLRTTFAKPLSFPAENDLGLVAQVTNRLRAGELVYAEDYARSEGSARPNRFASGAWAPYWGARRLGLDWRFASVAGWVVLAGVWAAGVTGWRGRDVPLAAMLAGLLVPGLALLPGLVRVLTETPLAAQWPMVLLLGLSLSARWPRTAAAMLGLLAASSAGWVLLLPLGLMAVWREHVGSQRVLLALALVPPVVAYAAYWNEFSALFSGVVGSPFYRGADLAKAGLGDTLPTLAGIADGAGLRNVLYVAAALGLVEVARLVIAPEATPLRRLHLFALAAFVVLAVGPATEPENYVAHFVLLTGMVMGGIALPAKIQGRSALLAWGAVTGLLCVLAVGLVWMTVSRGPWSVRVGQAEVGLGEGWSPRGDGTAWGRRERLEIALPMGTFQPERIELELEAMGGPWVPWNPAEVRLNGIPKGTFPGAPGIPATFVIPVEPGDVFLGCNVITLEAQWARSPESFGLSTEREERSLLLRGLRALPASSAGATP